ncbi:MAG: hypothetical protein ACFFBY_01485 [Promethearchaeota archaeon]
MKLLPSLSTRGVIHISKVFCPKMRLIVKKERKEKGISRKDYDDLDKVYYNSFG